MSELHRTHFPWASVIRFGLGRLRLPPAQFWALSLPELTALLNGHPARDVATRLDIETLMARFPDGDAATGAREGAPAAGSSQRNDNSPGGPE